MNKRVTQKEIAIQAGLSRTTVSMALSSHPTIPAATRERVMAIAKKMGYAPDPMLSSLAAYRTARKPSAYHGTIAWLFNSSGSFDWKLSTHFSDYFTGSSQRARLHGYQIEAFDANEARQPTKRLMSVLSARNVRGILLCPQPAPQMKLDLQWDNFSFVTFGYSLASPHLNTVTAAHYLATLELVRRLREKGYRRIGFAIARVSVERSNFNYLGGYLINQNSESRAGHIPTFMDYIPELLEHPDLCQRFLRWIDVNKLDAIIAEDARILKILEKLGKRVPEDVAVASPCLPKVDPRLSGMVEDSIKVGAVAVDFLVGAIQRGETGIPESTQRIHVEGKWSPGRTI